MNSSIAPITLDGTCTINLDAGYTPTFGTIWNIMSGGSHSGAFAQVNLPTPPQDLIYKVVYEPNRVYVVLTCPIDLSCDGVINFFDVSAFLSAFSSMNPIADLTNDGVFNFFDVSAFLGAFSAGCP